MAVIVLVHLEIDDTQPLGPQIARARALGVRWKVLEEKLDRNRETLRDYIYKRQGPARRKIVGMQAKCAAAG